MEKQKTKLHKHEELKTIRAFEDALREIHNRCNANEPVMLTQIIKHVDGAPAYCSRALIETGVITPCGRNKYHWNGFFDFSNLSVDILNYAFNLRKENNKSNYLKKKAVVKEESPLTPYGRQLRIDEEAEKLDLLNMEVDAETMDWQGYVYTFKEMAEKASEEKGARLAFDVKELSRKQLILALERSYEQKITANIHFVFVPLEDVKEFEALEYSFLQSFLARLANI